ncbi:MAG: hypothetical protein Kow0092_14160 [Deferrisomatales bacterium]
MGRIVCIGGSTGAPAALLELLGRLPDPYPAPILVALHMPAAMSESYARSIDRKTPFRAQVAENDLLPRPGRVYVGPGGFHVGLGRTGRVVVTPRPQDTLFKPSIDVLFYTAARAAGSRVTAVVLTGLSVGKDGVRGALAVKEGRGAVLVIDEPGNRFLGMPKNVIDAGAATVVAPLPVLAQKLGRLG